ncbi:hypothetical protein HTZ97_05590 [Desulfuromonas acetoxidans]|nr:hypothetical protein [Desulfuromonas acetoxidans]NVD23684.1 hypothetical protein [Desulfuromonas acetoxidans]NVE15931.1 hypothetical protein [Desulfuromonas acetoxidans]
MMYNSAAQEMQLIQLIVKMTLEHGFAFSISQLEQIEVAASREAFRQNLLLVFDALESWIEGYHQFKPKHPDRVTRRIYRHKDCQKLWELVLAGTMVAVSPIIHQIIKDSFSDDFNNKPIPAGRSRGGGGQNGAAPCM